MIGNIVGPDLGVLVVIAVVVLFGGSQLPKIARNVGSAGKEFRKAQREAEEEDAKKAEAAAVPPAVTAGPAVTTGPAVATTPAAAVARDDDKVTISKAELAALLDERLGRGEASSTN